MLAQVLEVGVPFLQRHHLVFEFFKPRADIINRDVEILCRFLEKDFNLIKFFKKFFFSLAKRD